MIDPGSRPVIWRRTLTLLCLPTALLVPRAALRGQSAAMDSTRIARVERGLLRAVAVRGRPDPTFALAERMRRYGVPGVSIAVIDGGRVAWARGYGVLRGGAAGGAPRVDTATLFQAGSISKAVTGVAALRLVERRVLGLDDDVDRALTSWHLPRTGMTRGHPVTLRHLLSHTAGLNVPSFPGYPVGAPVPTLRQVLDGTAPAVTPAVRVETVPGTEWRYSGGGTSVVQQLLLDATGETFPALVHGAVLRPAVMVHSTFEQPLPPGRAARAAAGHSPADTPLPGGWRVYPELAAAGLWSTASDLARFGLAVQDAIQGRAGAVLRPATARDMLTPRLGGWGLGFAVGGVGDSTTFGHDGSTAGFTARLLAFRDRGQGVAVMTNGESEPLIDEIVRSVAREYGWPVPARPVRSLAAVRPAALDALAGTYRVEVGAGLIDVSVAVDGGRVYFVGSSGRRAEILPASADTFFSPESGTEFTFVRDGTRAALVAALRIDQGGQRFVARRLRAAP